MSNLTPASKLVKGDVYFFGGHRDQVLRVHQYRDDDNKSYVTVTVLSDWVDLDYRTFRSSYEIEVVSNVCKDLLSL